MVRKGEDRQEQFMVVVKRRKEKRINLKEEKQRE